MPLMISYDLQVRLFWDNSFDSTVGGIAMDDLMVDLHAAGICTQHRRFDCVDQRACDCLDV